MHRIDGKVATPPWSRRARGRGRRRHGRRHDLDGDPVQDRVAGERLHQRLVRQEVAVHAGVLARHAQLGARRGVAPAVRDDTTPGIISSVSSTGASISPAAERTRALPPSTRPSRAASSGCISIVQRSLPFTSAGRLCIHELFERRCAAPDQHEAAVAAPLHRGGQAREVGHDRLGRELDLAGSGTQHLGDPRPVRAEVDAVRAALQQVQGQAVRIGPEAVAERARCAAGGRAPARARGAARALPSARRRRGRRRGECGSASSRGDQRVDHEVVERVHVGVGALARTRRRPAQQDLPLGGAVVLQHGR